MLVKSTSRVCKKKLVINNCGSPNITPWFSSGQSRIQETFSTYYNSSQNSSIISFSTMKNKYFSTKRIYQIINKPKAKLLQFSLSYASNVLKLKSNVFSSPSLVYTHTQLSNITSILTAMPSPHYSQHLWASPLVHMEAHLLAALTTGGASTSLEGRPVRARLGLEGRRPVDALNPVIIGSVVATSTCVTEENNQNLQNKCVSLCHSM